MSENKQSCDCRRIAYPILADTPIEPGMFTWGHVSDNGIHRLYICLPGEKHMGALMCEKGQGRPTPPGSDVGCVWGWDGNEDRPTLTPSIHAPGIWHGWLRAGRLESCP